MPRKTRVHVAARKAPMPTSCEPMRPTLVQRPVISSQYICEIKWDGWRTFCFLRDGKARLVSRRKNSLSERFPELKEIGKGIKATEAILDGEIVALDRDGLPRFDGLRSRRDPDCSTVFYCFDLLYLDGYDLRNCPLTKRKALLKSILPKDNTGRIRYTDHVSSADSQRLFQKLEALQLEGMVMKRKDSVYASVKSRDWLKIKTSAGKEEIRKRMENW